MEALEQFLHTSIDSSTAYLIAAIVIFVWGLGLVVTIAELRDSFVESDAFAGISSVLLLAVSTFALCAMLHLLPL